MSTCLTDLNTIKEFSDERERERFLNWYSSYFPHWQGEGGGEEGEGK